MNVMECIAPVAPPVSAAKIENRRSLIYSLKVSVACHCSCAAHGVHDWIALATFHYYQSALFIFLLFNFSPFCRRRSTIHNHFHKFEWHNVRIDLTNFPSTNREAEQKKNSAFHSMAPADNHLLIEVVAHLGRQWKIMMWFIIYRYKSMEFRADAIQPAAQRQCQ